MDVREKLVELLWEYDQMRMMRMSIEECADRLITKGLTVRKYENDTKCSDFAICLDENAKQKTERIVDLMTSFYGVDPGYYGVEAYPLASHLIAHGVTVQEWISVKDRLPQEDEPEGATCEQVQVLLSNGVVSTGWCNRHTKLWWHLNYGETHFIGYDYEHTPVIAWQPLAQPPKGE